MAEVVTVANSLFLHWNYSVYSSDSQMSSSSCFDSIGDSGGFLLPVYHQRQTRAELVLCILRNIFETQPRIWSFKYFIMFTSTKLLLINLLLVEVIRILFCELFVINLLIDPGAEKELGYTYLHSHIFYYPLAISFYLQIST